MKSTKWFVLAFILLQDFGAQVQAQDPDERIYGRPRNIPLCISSNDENLQFDDKYREFIPILEELEKNEGVFYNSEQLNDKPATKTKILTSIRFSPITLNSDKVLSGTEYLLKDKPLGDGNTFNQWLHIAIQTKVPLQGLIVGAIHGPVGMPFGNFAELKGAQDGSRCTCCPHSAKSFVSIPCTRRPRGSLAHPDVFTWHADYEYKFNNGLDAYKGLPDKSLEGKHIHMNFKYTDVVCNRAAVLSFYVIGITDFNQIDGDHVEAVVSKTYIREVPTSMDGVAYPFHPDFCEAAVCEETVAGGDRIDPALEIIFRDFPGPPLTVDISYDFCILRGTPDEIDDQKTCPPGPFKCEPVDLSTETDQITMYIIELKKPCNCPAAHLPSDAADQRARGPAPTPDNTWVDAVLMEAERNISTEDNSVTRGPLVRQTVPDLKSLDEEAQTRINTFYAFVDGIREARSLHGRLMFLACCIAGSIFIFSARFAKDLLPGCGCCGRGVGLWVHIIGAIVSVASTLSGMIVLIFADQPNYHELLIGHIVVGSISLLLFYLIFFTGWVRPVGSQLRGICIGTHSIAGYLFKLFGVIAMVSIKVETLYPNILVFVLSAELVNLAFILFGSVIQILTDKTMKLNSKRKVCPYVEHKELETPVPTACSLTRNMFQILHFVILVLISVWAMHFWPAKPFLRSYYDIIAPGSWKMNTPLPLPTTEKNAVEEVSGTLADWTSSVRGLLSVIGI